ncbi:MAG: hypothetical protein HRU76_05080 [Phycisphaeraceae bacterium]|nr:hypothetical protein [Phycisphaerales bacterium]QOJ16071.1 MAG: hypothetical protein HRU76_05080 [Phycisphaeraceae bacterium]
MSDTSRTPGSNGDFAREAQAARAGVLREFVDFLRDNKKWWLVPLLVTFLLVGALIVLTSTGAGPFLYTLF